MSMMKKINYIQYFILILYFFQNIFLNIKKKKSKYKYHNGAPVSNIQFKLAKILNVKDEYINYKIGPYYADILFPRLKIIFEYDGYFWHKNYNKSKEEKRKKYLIGKGYKLIHIKSGSNLPNKKELYTAINLAKSGKIYQEIILEDWGE